MQDLPEADREAVCFYLVWQGVVLEGAGRMTYWQLIGGMWAALKTWSLLSRLEEKRGSRCLWHALWPQGHCHVRHMPP